MLKKKQYMSYSTYVCQEIFLIIISVLCALTIIKKLLFIVFFFCFKEKLNYSNIHVQAL